MSTTQESNTMSPYEGGYGSVHINNVSGLIRDYYSARYNGNHPDYEGKLKIETKEQYDDFVHEMYFDLGIWTGKDMAKEARQAADTSRPKVFQKEHDLPQDMAKRVDKIATFVRKQFRHAELVSSSPAPIPPSMRKNAPKAQKAEAGEEVMKLMDDDIVTKTAKIIALHFDHGFAPKQIAEMMSLSGGRVNNTLTKERKRRRENGE